MEPPAAATQQSDAAEEQEAPGSQPALAVAAEEEESTEEDVRARLKLKEAENKRLQQKLQHLRTWMGCVHARVQQMNPNAIKNAKRLYIGNLIPGTTEEELFAFLNDLMERTGGLMGPGDAVVACKVLHDKNYAFAEFRSVEEASNAMALDGVAYGDVYLKIRRPSNYDMPTSIMLGPTTPDPTIDTSTLDICRTVVDDSPHKLFIGGLPCDWGEENVKQVLAPYGTLRSFNLVMDKSTGKSKGFAFCEFSEEAAAEAVISALNGKKAGSKTLTVKRAAEGAKHIAAPGSTSSGGANGSGAAPAVGVPAAYAMVAMSPHPHPHMVIPPGMSMGSSGGASSASGAQAVGAGGAAGHSGGASSAAGGAGTAGGNSSQQSDSLSSSTHSGHNQQAQQYSGGGHGHSQGGGAANSRGPPPPALQAPAPYGTSPPMGGQSQHMMMAAHSPGGPHRHGPSGSGANPMQGPPPPGPAPGYAPMMPGPYMPGPPPHMHAQHAQAMMGHMAMGQHPGSMMMAPPPPMSPPPPNKRSSGGGHPSNRGAGMAWGTPHAGGHYHHYHHGPTAPHYMQTGGPMAMPVPVPVGPPGSAPPQPYGMAANGAPVR